jgi:iron-sulfur cluster repair protein YtfE (RIC family)
MTADIWTSPASQAVLADHQRLREVLHQIHSALVRRQAGWLEIQTMLPRLAREIESHFIREEDGGYFLEVVEVAPQLSSQVDRLRGQHVELLEFVRRLAEVAAATRFSESSWRDFSANYEDFAHRFLEHEVDEKALLHEAYNQDIGAEG